MALWRLEMNYRKIPGFFFISLVLGKLVPIDLNFYIWKQM